MVLAAALAIIAWVASPGPGVSDPAFVERLETAFENRESGLWIEGSGSVVRQLADDLEGDRHQRIIVSLPSGQTLLVSHNIDLAPRVAGLSVGDQIDFRGRYEWNDQGGVIHWTHHDPEGRLEGGWIEVEGRRVR